MRSNFRAAMLGAVAPSLISRTNEHATMMAGGVQPIANLQTVQQTYRVDFNQWEQTRGALYDSASYVAAGQAQLQFFNLPQGQGTGFGGAAKNLSDTNMVLAGMLPSQQMFLVENIEILTQPVTPSVASYNPAQAALATPNTFVAPVNDVYIVRRSGNFQLTIGNKVYVQEAPLMLFPPLADLEINAAMSDTTTAGAGQFARIMYAKCKGAPYVLDPNNLLITPGLSFSVVLAWPEGVQAISEPMRIFVRLNGTNYRKIQ